MLLAVIPVALVGRVIVNINNESLQYEVQRYHLHLAQSLAEKFDERLVSIFSQMAMAIDAIKNPAVSWEDRQKMLSALIDASPQFGIISAVAANGQELIKAYNPVLAPEVDKNPSLNSHAEAPLFMALQKAGKNQMRVFRAGDITFAEIYIPFETPGGRNAVYVKLSLNDLGGMIAKESIGRSGYATYIGKDGEPLSQVRGGSELDPSILKTALTGSQGVREFTDKTGMSWVGASAPVAQLGGAILTQQPLKEAYEAAWKGQSQAMMLTIVTILLAILVAFLLTRSLVRPLLKITQFAKSVDLTNGQFPEPVQIKRQDEIQELAQTFNNMVDKLKGYAEMQVEKLIIEQKKTEAIIFSIQDGIIMTDHQGRVQLINRMARTILSIPDNEAILGQPLWKYLPSPELKTACVDLLTNNDGKKMIDVKLPKAGRDNFYQLSSEQVRSPAKEEVLGLVTVVHDVTLEKELDSMKEEFLHSITHDLRNPLTAIRGFIRLFQSGQTGALSPIQTKMFETMDKASLRLMTMVNDILDLARLESNKLLIHIESCQLEDISNRVIELFAPQTKSSNIKLKLETSGASAPMMVDPNLIERVFTNLIGNATKFTPDGGSITVKLDYQADVVRCAVVDTGEGIPESYLEKVFDKFKQVEGHFKGGAGLGLTICKKIVEAHFGRIWVESKVGEGASFIFILPKDIAKRVEGQAAA